MDATLGPPASYLTLAEKAPVYAGDGTSVGHVEHVLADPEVDVFDGIVIATGGLTGDHRFVDASQVDEIYERGVLLSIDSAAVASLPEPSANPASVEAGPDDTVPSDIGDKLRRAWDRISGKE